MARREFEILDKNGRRDRSSTERYTVIKGNLDGRPEMYEFVGAIEDNCGYLSVYRDSKTTTAVSLEGGGCGEPTLVSLVGNEAVLNETFNRIKSIVPGIFTFKQKRKDYVEQGHMKK